MEPTRFELCNLVKEVANSIPQLSSEGAEPIKKSDGSYVTAVDQALQNALLAELFRRWPQYGAIGEEMNHSDQVMVCSSSENGYWVIDPLDGTTNFTTGFLFFGISVALVINGISILAVVYDPNRGECFSAEKGQGAYLNDVSLVCNNGWKLGECIANVDYKRLVGELAVRLVHSPPYRSQRNLGASVLEWCWLASGRIQLYLHGGQKLWDFAAGHLILHEAGGAATSLSGKALDCSSLRKRSVVAAVNPELLVQWSNWININRFKSDSPL